jgi:5-methylcytosine-specific restriction endonuclease McrA
MTFKSMSSIDSRFDLSAINLERTYSFADDVDDKKADWGLQLWRLLRSKLEFERPRLLRDNGESEFVAERFVNYALSRLIARGMLVEKSVAGLSEDARQEAFVYAVADVLDVDDETKDRVVWLLDKICARRKRKGGDLTQSQNKAIAGFAAQENHRCYICGQELSFEGRPHPQSPVDGSGPDWRFFEIEHMFPQSKGGGRHRTNLAACCQSCNKLKDDYLSFVDLPLEDYTTSSDDTTRVRKVFGPKGWFALLWRQQGKCASCDIPFHDADSETLVLQKRNDQDAYHFMNVQIICGECSVALSSDKISEVTIRE